MFGVCTKIGLFLTSEKKNWQFLNEFWLKIVYVSRLWGGGVKILAWYRGQCFSGGSLIFLVGWWVAGWVEILARCGRLGVFPGVCVCEWRGVIWNHMGQPIYRYVWLAWNEIWSRSGSSPPISHSDILFQEKFSMEASLIEMVQNCLARIEILVGGGGE